MTILLNMNSDFRRHGRKSPIVPCKDSKLIQGQITGLSRENDGVKLMDRIQESEDPLASLPALFASLEGPYVLSFFCGRWRAYFDA